MDTVGNKGARFEIAAIKVVAARTRHERHRPGDPAVRRRRACRTTGRSREMYTHARTLHLVDGPDEVHRQQIARRELRRYEAFRDVKVRDRLRARRAGPARRRTGSGRSSTGSSATGFDSLWLSERVAGDAPDPIVGLSFAAGRTATPEARHERPGAARAATRRCSRSPGPASTGSRAGGPFPRSASATRSPPSSRRSASPATSAAPIFDEALPLIRRLWTEEPRRPRRRPLPLRGPHRAAQAARSSRPTCGSAAGRRASCAGAVGSATAGWPASRTPADCARAGVVVDDAAAAGRRQSIRSTSARWSSTATTRSRTRWPAARRDPTRGRPCRPGAPWGSPRCATGCSEFIAVGLLEARARPLAEPDDWTAELEKMGAAVLDLQT